MRVSRLTRAFVCSVECMFIESTLSASPAVSVEPLDACVDFAVGNHQGVAWELDDCINVWTHFVETDLLGHQSRWPFVELWRETATELRQAGTPCLASSTPTYDGIGSVSIKLLHSWILAEEMGCDWLTPDWGERVIKERNGTATVYCHSTELPSDSTGTTPSLGVVGDVEKQTCSVVDWLDFFQFGVPSVILPHRKKAHVIYIDQVSATKLERQATVIRKRGIARQRWNRVLFEFDGAFASASLCIVGNWDETKREVARKALGEARRNFHHQLHRRLRFGSTSDYCFYNTARLNFAIHLRLGDRRNLHPTSPHYFQLLESFMDTITMEVGELGLDPPLFHVFAETLESCPSADTGLFDEFPTWPVGLEELPECLEAEIPDDCAEKLLRPPEACRPERSGIFYVVGKPLVLHVGEDVEQAMSCMIVADGLLMGCSTFGQMAGVLSKGISFFSMQCRGNVTPPFYQTLPPLAVAERGYMWVPVTGSWRDPAIASTAALRSALLTLLENRNSS